MMMSELWKVMNVATLNLLGETWRRSEDHAKWAVTADKRWICIGDINREVALMLSWQDFAIISTVCVITGCLVSSLSRY